MLKRDSHSGCPAFVIAHCFLVVGRPNVDGRPLGNFMRRKKAPCVDTMKRQYGEFAMVGSWASERELKLGGYSALTARTHPSF